MKIKIIICMLLVANTTGLRCYVCTSECENFNTEDKSFIQNCLNAKACGIYKNGTKTSRWCEKAKFNDCQTANNVEYCYCSRDLCNVKVGKFILNLTDDEDLLEGSGGVKLKAEETETLNVNTNSTTPSLSSSSSSLFPTLLTTTTIYVFAASVLRF